MELCVFVTKWVLLKIWDISSYLFGLGSLDSILAEVDLDLEDGSQFHRTKHKSQQYKGCMLSFRIDQTCQRRSPLVVALSRDNFTPALVETILSGSPQAVACCVALCDVPTIPRCSVRNFENCAVTLSILCIESACLLLDTAVSASASNVYMIQQKVERAIRSIANAWNETFGHDNHASFARLSLLASILDLRALLRHANFCDRQYRCFHVRFITALKLFSVTRRVVYGECAETVSDHGPMLHSFTSSRRFLEVQSEHDYKPSAVTWIAGDEAPRVFVPVEEDKQIIVSTLQLILDESKSENLAEIYNTPITGKAAACLKLLVSTDFGCDL
jgi:hypothetical protein